MKSHRFCFGTEDEGSGRPRLFRLGVRGGRGLHKMGVSLRLREVATQSREKDGARSRLGLVSLRLDRDDSDSFFSFSGFQTRACFLTLLRLFWYHTFTDFSSL